MAEQVYTYNVRRVTATPRSARLRATGSTVVVSSTTYSGTSSSTGSSGSGHTHDNLSDLNRIATTTDGYLTLATTEQDDDGVLTLVYNKVKAGYADSAATAGEASHAAKADEATHASEADHAAEADHATKADEATHATSAHQLDDDSPTYDKLLRKDKDDASDKDYTFSGLLTLAKFLSQNGATGDFSTGFAAFLTSNKAGRIETDELLVRNKAIFNELEVRKLSYTGGNIVLSPAGSTLEKVTVVDASGKEYAINDAGKYLDADGNEVIAKTYRCYYKADDGTTATLNTWKVGDQARCQTFNLAETGTFAEATNHFYWRLVTAVGNDYIDLSAADCAANSDIPAAQDTIVQMGNRSDTSRQGFIYLQSEGDGSPCISEYAGVYEYDLTGKQLTRISPVQGNLFTGTFQTQSGGEIFRQPVYRGDYAEGETYNYYDQVTYDGELWLCIVAEPNTTTETPSDSSEVWKRVTNNAEAGEWQLTYENDGSESVDAGETRRVIIKALKGVTDRTAEITTWKIERYTGDTTEAQEADAAWNAAHTSFQTQLDADGHPYVELTLADLGDDVNSARFTVTTTSPDTDDNTYITDASGNILTTDAGAIITYN